MKLFEVHNTMVDSWRALSACCKTARTVVSSTCDAPTVGLGFNDKTVAGARGRWQ